MSDTVPFDGLLDDELTRYTQLYGAMLAEMKAWDAVDAEDAASGIFPLPAQPYCESPRFKILTQHIRHIKAIQKQRLKQDEIPEHSLAPPQPTPHRHHHNIITNPPPDIVAPEPFPPSPNISARSSQSHLHPPHNRHLPDIVAPPPLPLKPNIPVHQ
jgi:hypothetical protein